MLRKTDSGREYGMSDLYENPERKMKEFLLRTVDRHNYIYQAEDENKLLDTINTIRFYTNGWIKAIIPETGEEASIKADSVIAIIEV